MGPIAARKAYKVLFNVERILAIELLSAGQGIDFQRGLEPAAGPKAAHRHLRSHIPTLGDDRILHTDMVDATTLLRERSLLTAVERAVGPLE